jgi:hypothetical protein
MFLDDQPAGYRSVELWATKGTDKKYFLILSTLIAFGAHIVSYSVGVTGSYPEGKVAGT